MFLPLVGEECNIFFTCCSRYSDLTPSEKDELQDRLDSDSAARSESQQQQSQTLTRIPLFIQEVEESAENEEKHSD